MKKQKMNPTPFHTQKCPPLILIFFIIFVAFFAKGKTNNNINNNNIISLIFITFLKLLSRFQKKFVVKTTKIGM
jgi:hypothetical protein